MPISQTESYFKNPLYRFLGEPMLFPLHLKWKLYASMQKPTQILP